MDRPQAGHLPLVPAMASLTLSVTPHFAQVTGIDMFDAPVSRWRLEDANRAPDRQRLRPNHAVQHTGDVRETKVFAGETRRNSRDRGIGLPPVCLTGINSGRRAEHGCITTLARMG
jgi:uncharacterized protein YfaP (DUF2135 family)